MVKVLHFADAHIDIAAQGKHDPETGLPIRVLDFLRSLDTIVETAIQENVDLVIFAGDAYKDRTPSPTFQREWGKRLIRLSSAKIPTLLLVGNHDVSPANGRAHTLQEFDTLEVPFIHVAYKPELLTPADLWNLPLQVIALPWVFRSGLVAALQLSTADPEKLNDAVGERLTEVIGQFMERLDPSLPTIFAAHASVQGAAYGTERTVMLGKDLVLPAALVKDQRLDFTALGHIHKFQDLNMGLQPPVLYPGSIERVDFGEANDEKYFVVANVKKGHTEYEARKLDVRRFIDLNIKIKTGESIMEKILTGLPSEAKIKKAIVRLVVDYPRDMDPLLDEPTIRDYFTEALEFHLLRRPQEEKRLRLPEDKTISSLSPQELLNLYWETVKVERGDLEPLRSLAGSIIESVSGDFAPEEEVE